MTKLEYVASGFSHTRITISDASDPEIMELYRDGFEILIGRVNHRFSLLYNAYTEQKFPDVFKHYSSVIYNIHADSGGLQMITTSAGQASGITEELKDQIYQSQGKYSDIAMCFDEIPLRTVGTRSRIGDAGGRYFDKDMVEEKAKITGRNLARQIEVFQEMKSKAKPMLIIQGNDYDSFMKWTECAMSAIPQEYHKHIAGVALSGATHGNGLLQDIERATYFKMLPIDTNHLHILGIGSIRRMLPYMLYSNSGFYDDDMVISYDSTTHTSGVNMGRYYYGGKTLNLSRIHNHVYKIVFNDINQDGWFDEHEIDEDLFHDSLNQSTVFYKDKDGTVDQKRKRQFFATRIGYFIYSISNFMRQLDHVGSSLGNLLDLAENYKLRSDFENLADVTDLQSFQRWHETVRRSKRIKSDRVPSGPPATLDDLFG